MVQSRDMQKCLYKTSQLNYRQQCLHFCIIFQPVSLSGAVHFLIFNEPYRKNLKASTHIHVVFFPSQCQKCPHKIIVRPLLLSRQQINRKARTRWNNSKNVNMYTIIHPTERRSERLRCQIQPSYETDATSYKVKESCTCFL